MVCPASSPARSPTRLMRPPSMATSARFAGAPLPSTTVPPEMIVSWLMQCSSLHALWSAPHTADTAEAA